MRRATMSEVFTVRTSPEVTPPGSRGQCSRRRRRAVAAIVAIVAIAAIVVPIALGAPADKDPAFGTSGVVKTDIRTTGSSDYTAGVSEASSAGPHRAAGHAGPPPTSCKGPAPNKVKRWGCFAVAGSITWHATIDSPPNAPCRSTVRMTARWSGSGGSYWIGDDMTIRRAWAAPARSVRDKIVMIGPATFDVRITGEVAPQGTCVPAETVAAGCGKTTIPSYTVGILPSIGVGPGRHYFWTPFEYQGQRPPDYSACGDPPMSVQPIWVRLGRYVSPGHFTLASVSQVGADKAAAAKILSTRVGRALVLRAQDRPESTGWDGFWTATIRAKRIR